MFTTQRHTPLSINSVHNKEPTTSRELVHNLSVGHSSDAVDIPQGTNNSAPIARVAVQSSAARQYAFDEDINPEPMAVGDHRQTPGTIAQHNVTSFIVQGRNTSRASAAISPNDIQAEQLALLGIKATLKVLGFGLKVALGTIKAVAPDSSNRTTHEGDQSQVKQIERKSDEKSETKISMGYGSTKRR